MKPKPGGIQDNQSSRQAKSSFRKSLRFFIGVLFVGGALLGPLKSVAIASDAVQVKISIPDTMRARISMQSLEAKDKRQLAVVALQQHLTEVLFEARTYEDPDRVKAWIRQAAKSRFQAYAPSWSVKILNPQEAEVNFVIAQALFQADLEKSEFGGQRAAIGVPAAGSRQSSSGDGTGVGRHSGEGSSTEGTSSSYASSETKNFNLATLLVDEKSREVYVLPPEAVAALQGAQDAQGGQGTQISRGAFVFKAGVARTGKVTEVDVNSQSTPLAERVGVFAQAALMKMTQGPAMFYNADWARQVLEFLGTAATTVTSAQAEQRSTWPPALAFSASPLAQGRGYVLVFSVRNAEKSGALEKLDFLRFSEGHTTRSYWSRHVNDPTLQESAFKAIEKVAGHFKRQQKLALPEVSETSLRLIVDKKVGEKDLVAIEGILKAMAGGDVLLLPYEVTRADVRYATPVQTSKLGKVVEKIRAGVPGVYARAVPGEGGYVQIVPQASQKK